MSEVPKRTRKVEEQSRLAISIEKSTFSSEIGELKFFALVINPKSNWSNVIFILCFYECSYVLFLNIIEIFYVLLLSLQ